MMDVFRDFLRHFLEVFIDDFVVFGSREEHLQHLQMTFDCCQEWNLKLNLGKCFFGVTSGILLGHRISKDGIVVDLDKVAVILALKHHDQ